MNRSEFIHLLEELLEQPADTLTGSDALDDHGWDSMTIVGFLAMVDEHFGFTPPPAAIAKCRVVEDLIALLGDRVAVSAAE